MCGRWKGLDLRTARGTMPHLRGRFVEERNLARLEQEHLDQDIRDADKRSAGDETRADRLARVDPKPITDRRLTPGIATLHRPEEHGTGKHRHRRVRRDHDAEPDREPRQREASAADDAPDLEDEAHDRGDHHGPDRGIRDRRMPAGEDRGNEIGDTLPLERGREPELIRHHRILYALAGLPARKEQRVEQGRGGERAGEDADAVTDRLLARLGAEHVARRDVHEQVCRVGTDFDAHNGRHDVRRGMAGIERTEPELGKLREGPHRRDARERGRVDCDQGQQDDERDGQEPEIPAHAEPRVHHPDPERADDRDADKRDPERQLDVSKYVLTLILLAKEAGEGRDDHLRLREQRDERGDHHDGDAPPQRPGVDHVDARERAVGERPNLAGIDHRRDHDHEVHEHAHQHAGGDANPDESTGSEHDQIESRRQTELADVDARELREGNPALLGEVIVPGIQALGQVPGRLEAEELDLSPGHQVLAGYELEEARAAGCDRKRPGLEHPGRRIGGAVEGVEHGAAGPTLGECALLVVDEAPLHRERDQHAQERQDDVERHHLPPRHEPVLNHHVRGHAGDERARHVAGRGCDRLHGVALEDADVVKAEARHDLEHREGDDHGGDAHPERPAGLGADVQVGRREQAAQNEARDRGA